MNDSNESDDFLLQAWQLSILVHTNSTNLTIITKLWVGWFHIFEFSFIIISAIIVVFCHFIMLKSSGIKILHNNMKVFFHHAFAMFYAVQLLRTTLFICAFSGCFSNVSMFGPLQLIHILREFGLMLGASDFAELTIDRVFATINPERYEQQKRPYISIFLISSMYIYVAVIEVLRYIGLMSMVFMPILIGFVGIATLPVLLWVFRKNKEYLKFKYTLSLNTKFQIRENIRICLALLPGAVGVTIAIIGLATIYFLVFIMSENRQFDMALILTTLFNFTLQILFILTPLFLMIAIPDVREQALNTLCRKPLRSNVQRVTPMVEEQNIYFSQLKSMWEKPESAKFLPNVQ